jgi:NifU-like protein involved in Fe-S cluster formation
MLVNQGINTACNLWVVLNFNCLLQNTDIASHLKLPPVKLHCSMLAEDAIKAAIKDLKSKNSA